MDTWIITLQALLTPTIGVATVYIAYQQWQTNDKKWRYDTYERRLKIYQEVDQTLRKITSRAAIEDRELLEFRRNTAEAAFLFGKDVQDYLEEIFSRGLKLSFAVSEYRANNDTGTPRSDYDHMSIVKQKHEELTWFGQQHEIAIEKFKKEMYIGT